MSGTAKSPAVGATPPGAQGERAAAATVREMFTAIAPRYDLLNHVLSLNVDRLWWRRTARTFTHILARPEAHVLDLCCGTGDMALALRRQAGRARPSILGVDFSHAMLQRASAKFAGQNTTALEADALQLPFAAGRFDLVVTSFGFRNLANYEAGLREIHRVLAQGGEAGILDFSEPRGRLGKLYGFYFRHMLPRIGTLISGVRGPYQYLPASVARFPTPEEMLTRMRTAGFSDASWTPYTFGIAGLFRGIK
ncbi:MAG: ubiquinone/menaquinone biosynthesis methyltransferase [Acidobacteria bacterium]|nr:ubiquinone/menaquinone biosynthesis methyltransferase [Acidobacteriota bacterium]